MGIHAKPMKTYRADRVDEGNADVVVVVRLQAGRDGERVRRREATGNRVRHTQRDCRDVGRGFGKEA